jgi:hypothetical protein
MFKRLVGLGASAAVILSLTGCGLSTHGLLPDSLNCGQIRNVHVLASPDGGADYDFTGDCPPYGTFTVFGIYQAPHDGNPGSASETITQYSPEYHKGTLYSRCNVDPWYTGHPCTFTGIAGDATLFSQFIDPSTAVFPVSSSALTNADRNKLKAAKDAWKNIPCAPQTMKLRVVKPVNTTYLFQVPVQVGKFAIWCKSSDTFELDWQYLQGDPQTNSVTWTEKAVLATLDQSQQPNGELLPHSSFTAGLWRVRARQANTLNAPWSDWAKFRVQ